jgi:diacylglycerol kinase family enzyme
MKVSDRYAIYVVAAGAFTSATYNAPQKQKNFMGRIAYGLEGVRHNLKVPAFNIRCAGESDIVETNECVLVTFMNSKYVGGFRMNKRADVQDGKIEVAIVQRNKKNQGFIKKLSAYLAIAGLFLFGYQAKLRNTTRMSGAKFDINVGDDIVWNIDGEKGMAGNIQIEVVPSKINIIVPKKKLRKKKAE